MEERSLNETVFTAVYEWSASKIIEILLSTFSIFFMTPLIIYLIWYERFGTSHRTLINQFVASQFYYAVLFNFLGQPLDIIITAFGPFGSETCHFRKFVRGILTFQLIQLQTAIITVKYFYCFVIKNTAGIHEDFWCFFVNVWTLLFSCITQFVYYFLPGRNQITFYICSGTFNYSLVKENIKQNYALMCYLSLAIIWYVFAAVKIFKYKQTIQNETAVPLMANNRPNIPLMLLKDMFKLSLVNLVSIAVGFSALALSIAVPVYISTLEPASFNKSPNFELYHFTDHGFIASIYVCIIAIFYPRNVVMRQTIFREMKDDWLKLKEKFSM
jgi:hypothetical protein